MLARTSRLAALALLAILVGSATGCASDKTVPPIGGVETSAVAPSGAASATVATATPPAATGPVSSAAGGAAHHLSVFKAAMDQLGMSGTVTVPQLFLQGTAAVGDLKPTSGQRMLFAMTGGPNSWHLVWSAPFGSSRANAAALTKVDPTVFKDLARALDFHKSVGGTTVAAPGPTLKSFEAYALASAKSVAGATYTGTFTIQAKTAKDASGVWWGNAIAEPGDPGLESIGVWGRWNGKKWVGEIADFSTEGAEAGYFPAGVLSKLAL